MGSLSSLRKKRERGLDEVRGVVGERPFVALDRPGGTERPMRTSRRRWIRGAKHHANGDEPHVERLVFTVLNPKTQAAFHPRASVSRRARCVHGFGDLFALVLPVRALSLGVLSRGSRATDGGGLGGRLQERPEQVRVGLINHPDLCVCRRVGKGGSGSARRTTRASQIARSAGIRTRA